MLQVVLISFLKGKQKNSATDCVTLGVNEPQAHIWSWPLFGFNTKQINILEVDIQMKVY